MSGMEHIHHATESFWSLWRPDILLLTIAIGVLYFYLAGAGSRRFRESAPLTRAQKISMITALAIFYIGQGSPLSFYGHSLFSFHMFQQSLLYLLMPPLVFLAIPDWMLRPLIEKRWIKSWLYPLTHPLLTVIVFNFLFSMYHVPMVMDYLHEARWMIEGAHIVLLLSAFHMWFPVFNPVKSWKRMGDLQKIAYIFADGVLLTPACAMIIFAGTPLYASFSMESMYFAWLPVLDDQQLGGTIMKIMQEIIYGVALAFIFFKWYRRERKAEDDAAEDTDGSLRATQLPTY